MKNRPPINPTALVFFVIGQLWAVAWFISGHHFVLGFKSTMTKLTALYAERFAEWKEEQQRKKAPPA